MSVVQHEREQHSCHKNAAHLARFLHRESPLGLGHIAAYLESNGYSVRAACLPHGVNVPTTTRRLKTLLHDYDADLVGFSGLTMLMDHVYMLAQIVKAIRPRCTVVVGGTHPSGLPQRTLEECEAIDVVVIGEGEHTMLALIEALSQGMDLGNVAGLAFRQNGRIKIPPPRDPITDLDSLPMSCRDIIDQASGSLFFINAVRGCKSTCRDCPVPGLLGPIPRFRSPQSIVDEIETMVTLGAKHIIFPNCIPFVSHKAWTRQLCQQIVRRGLLGQFNWQVDGLPHLLDEEIIALLADTGVQLIDFWNVRSGHAQILANLGKPFTISELEATLACCKRYGVHVGISFSLGNPGETEETIRETVAFAERIEADRYWFGLTRPFPGTYLYRVAPQEGAVLSPNQWSLYEMDPPRPIGPLAGSDLSVEETFEICRQLLTPLAGRLNHKGEGGLLKHFIDSGSSISDNRAY